MEMTIEKTRLNDYVTNKTIKDDILNDEFMALSNGEKKSLVLTTTNLLKDTSVYGTSSGISNHHNQRLLTDFHELLSPMGNDLDEFFNIDMKEFHRSLKNQLMMIDGSGETVEPTSETTEAFTTEKITSTLFMTTSIVLPIERILSGNSTFIITLNCTNAYSILMNIFDQLSQRYFNSYQIEYDNNTLICSRSLNIDVEFTILTNDNVIILTNLYQTLESITSTMGIILKSINQCGINQTVTNVNSCYLINLCNLCGTNPRRGICLPEKNVSRCQCFIDENNSSITYIDEFCKISKENSMSTSIASWVPIVLGILGGILVICCVIIFYLSIQFNHHYRKQQDFNQDDSQINQFQCLSRAPIPTNNIQESLIQTNFSSNIHPNPYYFDPIDTLIEMIDNENIL